MNSQKLFIPPLGTRLELVSDWEFTLHDEYRNYEFWIAIHGAPPGGRQSKWFGPACGGESQVVLPKGMILSIERIFIRKGANKYDSVTFRTIDGPVKSFTKKRFWVKLEDANSMEVIVYEKQ